MYLLLLISLIWVLPASAYIENRGLFPLGEAEGQMANTGIALGKSSGSAYFNPAGLASLRERKLSLSGNTYMFFRTELNPLVNLDNQDLNFSASGVQIVPSSLVSTWTSGAWTYAFGVYVPELLKTSFIQGFSTNRFDIDISRTIDNQLLLVGLSAGGSLNATTDFGYSCFAGQYQSTESLALVAQPKTGSGVTHAAISNVYSHVDVKGFICQAGVQSQYSEKLRLGAVIRLPFVNLSGDGQYSLFTQAETGQREATGIQNKVGRYAIPLETAFGAVFQASPDLLLLADASYQFAEDFELMEGTSTRTKTKATLRYSLGMDYGWRDNWKIRAGYGVIPGAIELQSDGDSREDYQILTLGSQYTSVAATTGLGLFYAFSKGVTQLSGNRQGEAKTTATAIMLNTGFVF